MATRHGNRYAQRIKTTLCVDVARRELSSEAFDSLQATPDVLSARIFRELLEREYLQPARRGYRWTAKAEQVRQGLCAA